MESSQPDIKTLIPVKIAGIDLFLPADGKIVVRKGGASNILSGLEQHLFLKIWNAIDGRTTVADIAARITGEMSGEDLEAFLKAMNGNILHFQGDDNAAALQQAPDAGEQKIQLTDAERKQDRIVLNHEGIDPKNLIKRVVVVGGGTAGYFTALAFRKLRPDIEVTLIESSAIPVIGVGEASTPVILSFMHQVLGIHPMDLYRAVRPSWKLGIRFDWGLPGDYHFYNPFGLNNFLETDHYNKSLEYCTLGTTLMMSGKGLIGKNASGEHYSLLNQVGYAYHLENRNLIAFLRTIIKSSDIKWMDRTISDVKLSEDGEVSAIVTDGGEELSFDLYIDCSGFRSLLLGGALKSEFIPYSDSLFTDRAITGSFKIEGNPNPYTLAQSMRHGWNWNIPVDGENHRGYVHSSAFCSVEEAIREMQQINPQITDFKEVKFRSGRHKEFWKKNVVGIGNAYAFVEPLESTGLHMIIESIKTLLHNLPLEKNNHAIRGAVNEKVGVQWDYIKWFLAIHFKYNRKYDTPYWQHCREKTDVSGIQELLDIYSNVGPLTTVAARDPEILKAFVHDQVFGPHGFDYMLMGQKVPWGKQYRLAPERSNYPQRRAQWDKITAEALSHKDSLNFVLNNPELMNQII